MLPNPVQHPLSPVLNLGNYRFCLARLIVYNVSKWLQELYSFIVSNVRLPLSFNQVQQDHLRIITSCLLQQLARDRLPTSRLLTSHFRRPTSHFRIPFFNIVFFCFYEISEYLIMREEAKQFLFIVNGRQSLTITMYNRKINNQVFSCQLHCAETQGRC